MNIFGIRVCMAVELCNGKIHMLHVYCERRVNESMMYSVVNSLCRLCWTTWIATTFTLLCFTAAVYILEKGGLPSSVFVIDRASLQVMWVLSWLFTGMIRPFEVANRLLIQSHLLNYSVSRREKHHRCKKTNFDSEPQIFCN